MKVKMSFSPVVCYFLLFILLDVAVKSQMSSNSNSHTFLQTNDDVRYIVESIPIPVHKEFSSSSSSGANVQSNEESTIYNPKAHVKFEPPLLDFKERPFGVPHQEKVFIVNRDANKTIHLNSISGNSVHFHSSFFEDKLLLPLTNTSFSVVFLGHEEGQVDTSLFIHTSDGSFKYQVRGSSVQSPYRLRPLAGVRLPLNASFNPLIYMHNPYGTPLQLVEVYSSGGEFHLELPSGELEGPKNLWEIPAFLTKPVIRVRFHARAQKNHTAYIRLKVNHSEEVLVVPLEVEVGGACGLYCPEDVVDFGIGGSLDPPSTRTLALHNSWKKPIKIQNVISTPVSKALRIDFQPVNVPPETNRPVTVASLTFDWAEALKSGQTSGRIVVKSKQSNQKLVIPYQATVLQGGLDYDQATTRFRSDEAAEPRIFTITNNFQLPVVITKVNLSSDATPYFELKEFEPKIVEPGRSADLFRLVPSLPHRLTLDATIHIHTNVSTLGLPLLCFDGKLVMVISRRNETELELGTVGSGTEKQVVFALVNRNPVPVRITGWLTSLPNATVSIVSVKGGDVHSFLANHTLHNETSDDRVLGPTQFAVIRALVKAGSQVGETMAHVIVHTEYETMEVPCHMRVEHGSLQVTPDPIVFKNCFPGKVCTESMRVQSLFSVAMAVTAVSAVPPDPRLSFSPSSPPLLLPAATTDIGTLSFDTDLLDQEDNYLTSSLNDTGATRWQDTLELPAHCLDYDLSLLASRYNHYFNVSSRLVNLTLRLDTTEVREHMLLARVMLRWPLLARDVAFPLTQVGNTTSRLLTIHNPGTRHPVTVQLVLESTYLSAAPVIENLPSQLRPEVIPGAQSVPGEFIIDAAESPHRAAGPHIHRGTWVFVLPPETNTTVRVFYKPSGAHLSSALLLLRSNLTVLETVQLSGTGAFAQFKFGNRKPGSTTPLLFDLAEKHLKDCEREKQRKLPTPNLTVKRSFTARNTGPLPISVHGFQISGIPCEGYGFRVLNCEPFQLAPNSTRKVDIAFTPDFTLARVQRTLAVLTSESPTAANYTLVATLPPFLLSTCSVVLARPAWEPLLYYCAITFMVFLLVCVLAAAFLESDRALKCALLAMSRDNAAPVQPVLDLKSIGTGVGLQGGVGTLPPLSADKSEMQPSSISWSKPPHPPSPTAHELEAVKEKLLKSEVEGGIVGVKCTKRKEKEKEREKTAGGKRSSEPPNTNSWPTVFKPSAVVKPQPKPVSPPDPEQSKAACETTKRKLTKKTSNLSRCTRELASLPICQSNGDDTETSSTTTESSHDDGDKEVEVTLGLRLCEPSATVSPRAPRGRGKIGAGSAAEPAKKSPVANVAGSASSLEWDDEEAATASEREREPRRSREGNVRNRKTNAKSSKLTESGQPGQSGSRSKSSNSAAKQSSGREKAGKEKQALVQKRSLDKLPSLGKPMPYEAPPPPLTLWDESRASFSDVVARSDSSKPAQESAPTLPCLPPQPLAPATLGPIGSKKACASVWEGWGEPADPSPPPPPTMLPTPTPVPASASSFFMDSFTDTRAPQTQQPAVQNTMACYDRGWSEHPSSALASSSSSMLLKMIQAQAQEEQRRRIQTQEEMQRRAYHDTWSPWESLAPVPSPPSPAPVPQSLWGNDVWAPPPPPDTWAPPGLAPRPPPRLDDPANPDMDIGLDYDPFRSLSNIWAPHSSPNNFWKPPTTN